MPLTVNSPSPHSHDLHMVPCPHWGCRFKPVIQIQAEKLRKK